MTRALYVILGSGLFSVAITAGMALVGLVMGRHSRTRLAGVSR